MNQLNFNYTVTPIQAVSKPYIKALTEEIMTGELTTLEDLDKIRINHPEILTYKAKILGGRETYSCYADWVDFLITDYGPRKSCLSLGSGLGRVEKYLLDHGFSGEIEAIDLCADVNTEIRIDDTKISAQKGDLNFVKIKPNTYDFILCHGVLHHLINLEHILYQINGALTEDGLFLIYEYVGETRWQFSKERMVILEKYFPDIRFQIPPRWKVRGFEAIRSSDLLPLIKACFNETCERSVSYGGIYFPFVTCAKASEDIHMRRVIELDEELSMAGRIQPCYHMGLYRKGDFSPPLVRPWSDEEVEYQLDPPEPFLVKKYQYVRTSYLGRRLRKLKKKIIDSIP